jgi:hypothetical protein
MRLSVDPIRIIMSEMRARSRRFAGNHHPPIVEAVGKELVLIVSHHSAVKVD